MGLRYDGGVTMPNKCRLLNAGTPRRPVGSPWLKKMPPVETEGSSRDGRMETQ
jgi:hypothetical protein